MFPHDREVPEQLLKELVGIMMHAGLGESLVIGKTNILSYPQPRRHDLERVDIRLFRGGAAKIHLPCEPDQVRWQGRWVLRLCGRSVPWLLSLGYPDRFPRTPNGVFGWVQSSAASPSQAC